MTAQIAKLRKIEVRAKSLALMSSVVGAVRRRFGRCVPTGPQGPHTKKRGGPRRATESGPGASGVARVTGGTTPTHAPPPGRFPLVGSPWSRRPHTRSPDRAIHRGRNVSVVLRVLRVKPLRSVEHAPVWRARRLDQPLPQQEPNLKPFLRQRADNPWSCQTWPPVSRPGSHTGFGAACRPTCAGVRSPWQRLAWRRAPTEYPR